MLPVRCVGTCRYLQCCYGNSSLVAVDVVCQPLKAELVFQRSRIQLVAGYCRPAGILSRVTRPQQSWQYSGMQTVEVDEVRPVAVAAYLKGVTRRDDVDSFCLQDILHRGGQGCILIDRVIHEIAYKVARALKFGS